MNGVISRFWNKILLFMDNSVFFRFIDRIFLFFKTLFSKSVLVTYCSTEIDYGKFDNSFFVKLIKMFFNFFSYIGSKFFIKAYEHSLFVMFFKTCLNRLLGLKLYCLGAAAVAFAAVLFIFQGFAIIQLAVLIAGFVLLPFKQTLIDVLDGSFFIAKLLKVFDFEFPGCMGEQYQMHVFAFGTTSPTASPIISGKWTLLVCGLLGAGLGLVFNFIPYPFNILAPVGFVGTLLVIAYPFIGILGIVAAAPFLPTMYLATGLGFIMLCFLLKLATDKNYKAVIDYCGFFIFLFIAITIFVGFNSYAPDSSIKIALLTTLFMFSYFLTINLVDTNQKLQIILFTFSTSAFVTGILGLYQKSSGNVDMTWVDSSLFQDIKVRVVSSFNNPNVFGEYLLLAIPVCFAMVFLSKKLIFKLYYLGVTVLLLLNLGLTYSRGCYLALVFAAFVFVLFMEKRLITFFSIGVFMLPLALPATILNRITSITNLTDSSTSYRISIWQATIRILRDFWYSGLGQGIDAYNVVYPLYGFNSVSAPHSHNLYLQVFVETGIVGLIFFLALLLAFFKTQVTAFLGFKDNYRHKIFIAAAISAVIAFLIQGIFDYVFYNYSVFLIFFLFLGIANAYSKTTLNKSKASRK